jgi:hypothetical protein
MGWRRHREAREDERDDDTTDNGVCRLHSEMHELYALPINGGACPRACCFTLDISPNDR